MTRSHSSVERPKHPPPAGDSLEGQLEYYKRRCAELEAENAKLRERLASLETDGVDWNNNAAERALRSSVVIRKITYGNQSDEGARAHAVLMSIKGTCSIRKENFFDYAMGYLTSRPTSEW